jgi:hypothetical protein
MRSCQWFPNYKPMSLSLLLKLTSWDFANNSFTGTLRVRQWPHKEICTVTLVIQQIIVPMCRFENQPKTKILGLLQLFRKMYFSGFALWLKKLNSGDPSAKLCDYVIGWKTGVPKVRRWFKIPRRGLNLDLYKHETKCQPSGSLGTKNVFWIYQFRTCPTSPIMRQV